MGQKALAAETDRHGNRLNECERNRQVTRIAQHLLSAVLALPLQLFELRDGNRHQFHDNGRGDVRRDAECQYTHLLKRAAGDRIEEIECIAGALTLLFKEVLQIIRIHARNGKIASKADHNQHQQGEKKTISNLLDF